MWNHRPMIQWSKYLIDSYDHWTQTDLFPRVSLSADAQTLFSWPFPVVSHGIEQDPILNYANLPALALWETDWEQFTRMPSRLTVEKENEAARQRMLDEVGREGYMRNYSGARITARGSKFQIQNATIWKVLNDRGQKVGTAAMILHWTPL